MIERLRRVVIIKGSHTGKEGWFHKWGQWATEDGSHMSGIVEFDDGTCDYEGVESVKFIDKNQSIGPMTL